MPRGSKPGEHRGGRKKGKPNKATVEIKGLAQQWGPAAIEKLAEMAGLMTSPDAKPAESEQAKVAAVKELLDRGYGKATQFLEHSADEGLESILDRIGRL